MATLLKTAVHEKYTDCACRLKVHYALQRNNQPMEGETRFEPTDDAVYKIVVTNTGDGYAKDVKALAWLTATPPGGESVDLPDDLRIIPHGLLGQFKLKTPPTGPGWPITFPSSLTPIPGDLDLDDFQRNAIQHHIPFPPDDDDDNKLVFQCNVIRFGDIPAEQTKVACLTILSEGAPENTNYEINLFFKFDCCRLVQVPVPVCRQVEYSVIKGEVVQED